ncbi:MAG: VOC family protein, partial [Magnetococcus sp. XQGC-1]
MRILHTMLRVTDLERSIKFYKEVLGYAETLLGEGKLREVFDTIGRTFVLTDIDSSREEYHISEVVSFYGLVARYVLRLGKIKTAMSFLSLLQKVEPDHRITKLLEEMVDRHTPRRIPADARRFLSGR